MTQTPELFRHNSLTKEEQDRIDRAVPQMLQQIDPKVLVQFLKASDGNANINIVTIGKYYAKGGETEPSEDRKSEVEELQNKVEELQNKLREARDFGLLDWLEGLPQPRHEYMIREVAIALKQKFETQKECAAYIGVTPRVFSYWMQTYQIPGYKPNPNCGPKKGKKKEK